MWEKYDLFCWFLSVHVQQSLPTWREDVIDKEREKIDAEKCQRARDTWKNGKHWAGLRLYFFLSFTLCLTRLLHGLNNTFFFPPASKQVPNRSNVTHIPVWFDYPPPAIQPCHRNLSLQGKREVGPNGLIMKRQSRILTLSRQKIW